MRVEKHASVIPYGPRDAGIPMDLDEFEGAELEEGHRYELIHGVLVVTPWPLEEERDANEELGCWLRNYKEGHPRGGAMDLTLPGFELPLEKLLGIADAYRDDPPGE
jgi:hypothetical protein